MCVMAITAIASIGLGIAQAAAQQQAAMADYQNKVQYRKEQEIQNQKTLNQQVANMQQHAESQTQKTSGAMFEERVKTARLASTASVASIESGRTGLSTAALLGSIKGEGARAEGTLRYNASVADAENNLQLKMAQRGAQARLAEIPIPVKPRNTFGIDALSAVVGGVSSYMSNSAKMASAGSSSSFGGFY